MLLSSACCGLLAGIVGILTSAAVAKRVEPWEAVAVGACCGIVIDVTKASGMRKLASLLLRVAATSVTSLQREIGSESSQPERQSDSD